MLFSLLLHLVMPMSLNLLGVVVIIRVGALRIACESGGHRWTRQLHPPQARIIISFCAYHWSLDGSGRKQRISVHVMVTALVLGGEGAFVMNFVLAGEAEPQPPRSCRRPWANICWHSICTVLNGWIAVWYILASGGYTCMTKCAWKWARIIITRGYNCAA